jgi:hypothetical protein
VDGVVICEWAAIGSADGLAYHLVPIMDAITHSTEEPCICGPAIIPLDHGRAIVNHHSLVGSKA